MNVNQPNSESDTYAEIHSLDLDFDNRIIYLQGSDPIAGGEEPGVDYRMSSKFIKNINILQLASKDPIYVHMNTIGGEWAYGMAIFDAIMLAKCHVTIVAYSWARSMSSIIFQAADRRVMMPNASFMVHWGTSSEDGHYTAVKSSVEFQTKSEKVMIEAYADRCIDGNYFKNNNMNYDQVCEFIIDKITRKSDWWLTAHEAVEFGFADEVAY